MANTWRQQIEVITNLRDSFDDIRVLRNQDHNIANDRHVPVFSVGTGSWQCIPAGLPNPVQFVVCRVVSRPCAVVFTNTSSERYVFFDAIVVTVEFEDECGFLR